MIVKTWKFESRLLFSKNRPILFLNFFIFSFEKFIRASDSEKRRVVVSGPEKKIKFALVDREALETENIFIDPKLSSTLEA